MLRYLLPWDLQTKENKEKDDSRITLGRNWRGVSRWVTRGHGRVVKSWKSIHKRGRGIRRVIRREFWGHSLCWCDLTELRSIGQASWTSKSSKE